LGTNEKIKKRRKRKTKKKKRVEPKVVGLDYRGEHATNIGGIGHSWCLKNSIMRTIKKQCWQDCLRVLRCCMGETVVVLGKKKNEKRGPQVSCLGKHLKKGGGQEALQVLRLSAAGKSFVSLDKNVPAK